MALEISYGGLVNGVLKKSSTIIGQLATVHICDRLTKVNQIHEPSYLLVHAYGIKYFDRHKRHIFQ